LSNIYLNELDKYVNDLILCINKEKRQKISKIYNNLSAKLNWQLKKGNEVEAKIIRKNMIKISYYEDDELYKSIKYVRYADKILIGLRTSYKEATKIAKSVQSFIKKELDLESNFEIKNFTKKSIKFLEVLIKNGQTKFKYIIKNHKKFQQRIKTKIQFYAPINNIINKLIERGFMDKQHKGIPKNI